MFKDRIKTFVVSFGSFLLIDLIWLGFIAQPVYQHYLSDWLSENPNWFAAFIFYILFVVGLNYFALLPALKEKSKNLAIKNGAAFGFFTYMTYELTNYAVIDNWPLGIVPIDIIWGTFLAASVSYISYSLLTKK